MASGLWPISEGLDISLLKCRKVKWPINVPKNAIKDSKFVNCDG